MKETNWEECLETNNAFNTTVDKLKVRSLIEIAKGRITYCKKNTLNESSANFIFEGYYSSALELLHALILLKGYKVNNHICIGYYLRDILGKTDLYQLFDDCRFKRNSLMYYGKPMEFEMAKDAIQKILLLIQGIELILKHELRQN